MGHMPVNPNQGIEYNQADVKDIYIAGGCFWGAEAFLERIYGVVYAEVGYANGNCENPTYEQVCAKTTDFVETVYLKYDSTKITLEKLIDEYFKIIDPTSFNKQGGDIGSQYRTGIYSKDSVELEIAAAKIESLAGDYAKPILVEVKPLENYYRAEDYHQKYLEKNPNGYCHVDLGLLSN